MFIDLNQISRTDGASLDIKSRVDLSYPGDHSVSVGSVFTDGKLANDSGVLRISADIFYDAEFLCARCLRSFYENKVINVSNAPVENEFVDEFMNFDLTSWAESEVWSSLPLRFLCSDDCDGLCPVCGGYASDCSCKVGL